MKSVELESILAKIKAISSDNNELSVLERDLIKNYLLQAYELVDGIHISEEPLSRSVERPAATPPPQHVIHDNPPMQIKPSEEQIISEPLAPTPEESQPLPAHVRTPEYIPNGKPEEMQEDNVLVNLLHANPIDPKYSELFQWEQSTELSQQLSSSPISDLTKALAINDRLLYQNELFGGDADTLSETLDTLNRKPDFESAQVFLTRHLVDKFAWMSESKLERAREFVKFVARRFKD